MPIAHLDQTTCDVVVVAGGINDAAVDATVDQPAVAAFLASVRQHQPNALIEVLGPWNGNAGPTATTLAIEDAISAAVAARISAGDTRIGFIPVQRDVIDPVATSRSGWVGSLNAPAVNSTGQAWTGSPDNTHTSDRGHAYVGRRANVGIRTTIAPLLGPISFGLDLPRGSLERDGGQKSEACCRLTLIPLAEDRDGEQCPKAERHREAADDADNRRAV